MMQLAKDGRPGRPFRPLLLAFALCFGTGAAGVAPEPAVPLAAFAALPGFDRPVLSPDGESIAYLVQPGGHKSIVVQKLDGRDQKLIPPMDDGGEIGSFLWANNSVLLVTYSGSVERGGLDRQTHETRLLSFDLATSQTQWLGRPRPSRFGIGVHERLSQHETLVDLLPDDPDHILMALDFEVNGTPGVYRVDVRTGKREPVLRGKTHIQRWYTDQQQQIRLGTGVDDNGPVVILKDPDGNWRNLKKADWADGIDIEGFASDPHYLYVSGKSRFGTKGLYRLDLQSGQIVETLFEDEHHDAEGFVEHPVTGHLAGIRYTDDHTRIRYLDPDLERLQRSLDQALPGMRNRIVSKAHDRDLYLVLAINDRSPGDYYLYDRSTRQLGFIAGRRGPYMDTATAGTKAVSIPVRDGTTIPGYLTLPPGHETAAGLPVVIMPHGGPIGVRDDADWDWWAQFIANRGYAVLKPNYRGSGGYGHAYEEAGKNQWGGLMQDDVTDATRWLVKEQGADKDRLCIVGASYGGYAALMGLVKEPGLYKCAISVNGVADITALKRFDKGFVGGIYWTQFMGLEGTDDDDVSPAHRAKDIMAPVLLIAAKDDTRVPYKQSRDMDRALRKLKKTSRYVELETGTHQLVTAEARLTVLEETEKFLAQYLK